MKTKQSTAEQLALADKIRRTPTDRTFTFLNRAPKSVINGVIARVLEEAAK